GMFLNSFIRHAHIVKMANLAQIVNVIAPIFTNKQGMYYQTIFFPLAEYAKQRGNLSLATLVESPQYKPDNGRPLGYLDVSSTYNPKTREVFLNVLNRSQQNDIATQIQNVEGKVAGVDVWELFHTDLKATHTFGADNKVRPVQKQVTPQMSGNGFRYTFPKHSLSIMKLKLA
ncbi:MAG TPA: alpha-L-arabinofuranosidase A, partial [Bryobacteraceae bacterium]|nr:alpha-L-arabinofuranosidase A [Bryobacteraceae bacterium]